MGSTDITITPALSFIAVLNLLGAAQGVLLALALLTAKGGDQVANRLLAALTLTISIVVSGAVLLTSNYVFVFPHLSRVHQPFVFLAGPLLFLYIRELISREKRFEKKDFLHFIPFAVCLIYLLPYYFQTRTQKIKILSLEYIQDSFGQWYYIRSALFITQTLVYLILIVFTIIKYSRGTKARDSTRDRAILFEVRFFVIAGTVFCVGAILRYVTNLSRTNLLVPLGASLLIYAMGYLKMRRPEPQTRGKDYAAGKTYEKATLTPEASERN